MPDSKPVQAAGDRPGLFAKLSCFFRGHVRDWQMATPLPGKKPGKMWGTCIRCGDRVSALHPDVARNLLGSPMAEAFPELSKFIRNHTAPLP